MATHALSLASFKQQIFDYENEKEWKYLGKLPAIIDFYADWCGPCKMIAPVLEALADQYEGRLIVYKVNTEVEQQLAALFNIQSIPTLLFIPVNAQPMIQPGALPKQALQQIIEEHLI